MTTAPTDAAAKPATRTAYHILRRVTLAVTDQNASGAGKDVFELVYQALDAASADAAIRYFATGKPDGTGGKAIEGSYVAIPSRSFVEKTVKVETTTTVKLA